MRHHLGVASVLSLPAVVVAAVTLAGCVSPEPRQSLPLQSAPAFSQRGDLAMDDRWWVAFDDESLDERIDIALSGNYSLTTAWERLAEARAVARFERSALYPQLDGFAGGRLEEGDGIDEQSLVTLGLEASYEVDLWGRIRSIVESERLRASATASDYSAAAISVSAEVALTWYGLAAALRQLELIESQRVTNEQVLEVLEARFAVGQSGSADVLRQRQLVEASREQALVAQAGIELFEHQLAVLEGRPPQEATSNTNPDLPEVPGLPATGLPAELLERRPDVRSAFLRLEASDADVAAAVKDQYPRIDLAAALSTSAENPSGLFSAWLGSIAGQLTAPLFDGGRRRSEIELAVAARRQRLAEYGQAVLIAFQEVEDALTLEVFEVRRIESLRDQLTLGQSTYRQLGSQYLNGAADYIDVLTALREQQQLERSLIIARFDRVRYRIALYRALAGGFATPRELADAGGHGDAFRD